MNNVIVTMGKIYSFIVILSRTGDHREILIARKVPLFFSAEAKCKCTYLQMFLNSNVLQGGPCSENNKQ